MGSELHSNHNCDVVGKMKKHSGSAYGILHTVFLYFDKALYVQNTGFMDNTRLQ